MRRNPRMLRCLWLVALVLLLAACDERIAVSLPEAGPVADWPAWGGGAGGGHFTSLQEIRPDNLAALELVWTHRSGDFRSGPDLNNDAVDLQTTMPASAFQATPIVVEGRLYYCSPFNRVFALDPETGEQLWVHDPGVNTRSLIAAVCRAGWIPTSSRARAVDTGSLRPPWMPAFWRWTGRPVSAARTLAAAVRSG